MDSDTRDEVKELTQSIHFVQKDIIDLNRHLKNIADKVRAVEDRVKVIPLEQETKTLKKENRWLMDAIKILFGGLLGILGMKLGGK